MQSDIQFGEFTHAKCFNCGLLAHIDKFEPIKKPIAENQAMELYQLVLKCPICGDEFCEALFNSDVH